MFLYIDISAVSFAVPIITGIVVAVGAWLAIHFRRAKAKISKKLGIDENAGKEVEEDIVINDEQPTDAPDVNTTTEEAPVEETPAEEIDPDETK